MRQAVRAGFAINGGRLAIVAGLSLLVAGCAGGSWLESPSEADLPLEPPAHSYPTAIGHTFSPSATTLAESQPPKAANSAAPEPYQNPPRPPVTALAAIPPQYRLQPRDAAPEAIPLAPSPQPAQATSAAVTASLSDDGPAAQVPADENLAPIVSASDMAPPTSDTPAQVSVTPVMIPADEAPELPAAVLPAEANEQASAEATEPPAEIDLAGAWDGVIAALESEIRSRREQNASDSELPALEQQLRLAQLAAGQMDNAVLAIESLDEPQREAYKHLMFALGVWLSPDEARRAPLRSAKVLRSLRDAAGELVAASKLELNNLRFCERVDHFGGYAEFSRAEFRPKQPVILYAEVENFATEQKSLGYETELQGSYQVFDMAGRIVAERQLPLDREVCRNHRRDYFLAYMIYMPDGIADGKYRLELTIEDRKASGSYEGRKLGQGMIEFAIRQ